MRDILNKELNEYEKVVVIDLSWDLYRSFFSLKNLGTIDKFLYVWKYYF